MNTLQRIFVILSYEWNRALAKKKILALIILAIVIQVLPFVAFTQIAPEFLTEDAKATMWILGALGGQSLFIPLVAIIIAGGSMSEEYEHGTADMLLSKPIRRVEYMTGKFLGGFSLLVALEALMVTIGVLMGYAFFGPQNYLQFAPLIFVAIAYSSLLFFSLTFMLGEVFRKGTLAMLTAIGVFIASQILYGVLILLHFYSVTAGEPNQFYIDLSKLLPTWSAGNLPTFIASELMPLLNNPFITLETGEIALPAMIIAVYFVVSVAITVARLLKSDVAKKTD
jgi:ABC-2 type transport system permease protein